MQVRPIERYPAVVVRPRHIWVHSDDEVECGDRLLVLSGVESIHSAHISEQHVWIGLVLSFAVGGSVGSGRRKVVEGGGELVFDPLL